MIVLQWNANGILNKFEEMQILVNENHPAVICLQETRLRQQQGFSLRGYRGYRSDDPDDRAHHGLAILVESSYHSIPIQLNTNLEAQAIQIHHSNSLTICNMYLPPNENQTEQDLINLISQLPRPFMIVGDMNASNELWGCTSRNQRGNVIRKVIEDNDLIILNDGSPTHFSAAHQTFSTIDLSICSPEIAPQLSWCSTEDYHSSDHKPILISRSIRYSDTRHPVWITEKADWPKYMEMVSFRAEDLPEDIEDSEAFIRNKILAAAEASIPRTSDRPRKKNTAPWFDRECSEAKKDKVKAFRRFTNSPSTENLISFKRARAKAKYIYKNKRRSSWQEYLTSINTNTPVRSVWNKVKSIRGNRVFEKPVIRVGNDILTDPMDVADSLALHYSRQMSTVLYSPRFVMRKNKAEEEDELDFETRQEPEEYNHPFTEWEISDAIRTLKKSAPGPDNIHNLMIVHLPKTAVKALLAYFNRIWTGRSIPGSWKEGVIIPLLKPQKEKTDPNSYRPITLTNTICKLMEKIVNRRLIWLLEKRGLLAKEQSGFRTGRSTVDNLAVLEAEVLNSFVRGEETIGVFFDISKAYDRTWRHLIVKQLHGWGLRGHMPLFIKNLINNRRVRVRIGGTLSQWVELENGITQGSSLSCTLFGIAINSLPACLPPSMKKFLFVDDFAIISRIPRGTNPQRDLQRAILLVEAWADRTGFSFSAAKTSAILFTRKRNPTAIPILSLNNEQIRFSEEVRFLGVTLDNKLSWKPHIRSIRTSCTPALNLLRTLTRTSWGADRKSMLLIYRALVRSKLDYASIVYSSANQTDLQLLDSIHHTGLRIVTGAFKSSPVLSLCAEAGEPPLMFRRHLLAANYVARISLNNTNPAHDIIFNPHNLAIYTDKPRAPKPLAVRARRFITRTQTLQPYEEPNNTPPWTFKHPLLDLRMKKKDDKLSPAEKFRKYTTGEDPTPELIFTDGSKTDNRVGCAIVTNSQTTKIRLKPPCTIFTAEMAAISHALYTTIFRRNKIITICTDSLSALQSLQNLYTSDPIALQIHRYNQMTQIRGNEVRLMWTPGHTGIDGNEKADQAAKDAAQSNQTPIRTLPRNDIKNILREEGLEEWKRMWNELQGNKLRNIKTTTTTWKTSYRTSRKEEVVLARLRIGHSLLTHGHLMKREDPPRCHTCNTPISIIHIIEECPNYVAYATKYNIPRDTKIVLSDHEPNVTKIIQFFKDTGLYNKI